MPSAKHRSPSFAKILPSSASSPAQAVFITGTGTDVGKTYVTATLLRALARHGKKTFGLKPIQTGCLPDPQGKLQAPDVLLYREACPWGTHSALWCFEPACSPHLAAAQNNTPLQADTVAGALHNAINALPPDAWMCIEGSGGIMVPINQRETFLDVLSHLKIPTIIVCPNWLGTVNHTLLTALALKEKAIPVLGFILTSPHKPEHDSLIHAHDSLTHAIAKDNRSILEAMLERPCLGEIPWLAEKAWDKAVQALQPTVEALLHKNFTKGITKLCPLQMAPEWEHGGQRPPDKPSGF